MKGWKRTAKGKSSAFHQFIEELLSLPPVGLAGGLLDSDHQIHPLVNSTKQVECAGGVEWAYWTGISGIEIDTDRWSAWFRCRLLCTTIPGAISDIMWLGAGVGKDELVPFVDR